METSEIIKKLRLQSNLSQDELAQRVGYTDRSSIAKIEAGKVDLTESKIIAFSNVFGVSPAELMGVSDINKNDPIEPKNDKVEEIIKLVLNLPEGAQDRVLDYIRFEQSRL